MAQVRKEILEKAKKEAAEETVVAFKKAQILDKILGSMENYQKNDQDKLTVADCFEQLTSWINFVRFASPTTPK